MQLAEKYVYEVYRAQSFSAAAKQLFISQPALSAAVSRLEGELGFKIFDRSVIPIALTKHGKVYVEYLEDRERCENVMKKRIQDINNLGAATVSIGVYAYSAYCILPIVCKEFSKRYPGVKLRLDMGSIGSVDNLSDKLHRNSIDVMLNYSYDKQTQSAIPFVRERLLFAMHRSVLKGDALEPYILTRGEALSGNIPDGKLLCDTALLSEIPFFDYETFSNTRQKINALLGEYKHCDHRVENARSVDMQYRLMQQGVGAVLTSDLHVGDHIFDDEDIVYLAPASDEATRVLFFVISKDREISHATERFINVAKELFEVPKV